MLARFFALYILRSRWHASFLALFLGFVPLIGWLSSVVVGLVTLRRGWFEGAIILLWSMAPFCIFGMRGDWQPFMTNVVFGSLFVWLLAIVLRRYANWSKVLYATVIYGLIVLGITFLLVHNVQAWWLKQLGGTWQNVEQSVAVSAKDKEWQDLLQALSRIATGMYIALFSLMGLTQLFIARRLETVLINPRLLGYEVMTIRLPKWALLLLVIAIVVADQGAIWAVNMLPILLLPFLLAGISVSHAWLVFKRVSANMFFWFYFIVLMMVLFFQFLLIIFVGIAVIDSIFNLRRRFAH